MDVMGIAGAASAQKLQSIKAAAGTSVLSKAMEQGEQGAAELIKGLEQTQMNAKAAEMAVNPGIGSMFDMRV